MNSLFSLTPSLNFAADVARDFQIPVPEEWQEVAKKIKVPFDADRNYHPEYDGYSPGESEKQEGQGLHPRLGLSFKDALQRNNNLGS